MLNEIWDFQGETGVSKHTTEVKIGLKDEQLIIADYPGSTSIEHHAKAFSHCGSMNNLIFYLLKDTGNIDIHTKEQILKAQDIMGCTGDARIVFCINQAATMLRRREEQDNLGNVDVMKRTKAQQNIWN